MTLVGRLVAFCMFYVSIRVTLVDTSLLIRALYYDLIMLTFDISIMFHSVIHYAHPYDPSHLLLLITLLCIYISVH